MKPVIAKIQVKAAWGEVITCNIIDYVRTVFEEPFKIERYNEDGTTEEVEIKFVDEYTCNNAKCNVFKGIPSSLLVHKIRLRNGVFSGEDVDIEVRSRTSKGNWSSRIFYVAGEVLNIEKCE